MEEGLSLFNELDIEKLSRQIIDFTGQLKVHSTNKQVNFLVFKGNLSAGNYFSYG